MSIVYHARMKLFGKRLKELREARGLTQKELAALIDEPITNYNNIENGRRNFPKAKYQQLSEIFNIPLATIKAWRLIDDNPQEAREIAKEVSKEVDDE